MSELRYAFRAFFRQPGFTLAAAIVLALGIGASTAIYTLIRAVLLEPLAYPSSSSLVWIWSQPPQSGAGLSGLIGSDFLEVRQRSASFEQVAGILPGFWIVTGAGETADIPGARVSDHFFQALGVQPMLGRDFLPDEHRIGHEMEAIFTNRLWRQRFGADPGIIGRHVMLDGISYDVVGILPPGLPIEDQFDMFAPLQMDGVYATSHLYHMLRTFGRLKPAASIAQANADLRAIAADLASRNPWDRGWTFKAVSFLDQEVGSVRASLWTLAAAVGCVLLIACSNVASLLLARGAVRMKEMAVRAAVGASRAVLIRQLMMESALLAIIGGILGYPLALLGVRLLLALDPRALPRSGSVHADLGVLAFAFAVSLLTGMIFGIVPAIRGSQVSLGEALKEGSRSSTGSRASNRFRAALVVIEIALGVVLMTGAGLLARSLQALNRVQPGYRIDNVITMQLALTSAHYSTVESWRSFFDRLLDDLHNEPGVEAAGMTNVLPLDSFQNRAPIWIDTQPVQNDDTLIRLDNRLVTPGYFRAMGIPVLAGRDFETTDRADRPAVMIVNDVFAREFFPHGDAIGHRITIKARPPLTGEIIGVVGSIRDMSIAEKPRRELFTTYAQTTVRAGALVVRTEGNAAGMTAKIRDVLAGIDKDVPVYNVHTMRSLVDDSLAQPRFRGALLAIFSFIALLLASLGVYGVISCSVIERRQEIGIRVALGARIGQVRGMIVRDGLRLAAIGLALGLACAAAATRIVQGFLFGVTAADPITYAATAAIFVAVAVAASYIPARRATRLDPLRVLREE